MGSINYIEELKSRNSFNDLLRKSLNDGSTKAEIAEAGSTLDKDLKREAYLNAINESELRKRLRELEKKVHLMDSAMNKYKELTSELEKEIEEKECGYRKN